MNGTAKISSIEEFIGRVRADRADWPHAWFRGEPNVSTALVPKLYRPKSDGRQHDENRLLQFFRMKAPTFSRESIPAREATDQWLFLAQHVGLPTRLLDWTESALVGLYFALLEKEPIVWMLNPIAVNRLSLTSNDPPVGGDFLYVAQRWRSQAGARAARSGPVERLVRRAPRIAVEVKTARLDPLPAHPGLGREADVDDKAREKVERHQPGEER